MAREMKDSGIEWIGEIPIGWGTPKIINRFDFIGSGTTPRTYEDNYYVDGEINWIQSGDLHDKYLISTSKKITQMAFDRTSALKMYFPQYLVMAMYGASVGNLSIATIEACTNQACCVLTGEKDNLKYMYYVLMAAKEYLVYSAIGGTQPNISQNVIKNLKIPIPMIVEQQKIADVLDKKFEELDNVLEKTRASIEEYKKLKQALIAQAVTKGIRGDREMKDSGIEWNDKIPAEWDGMNPKALFRQRKDKAFEGEKQLTASQQHGIMFQSDYMELTGTKVVTVEKDFDILKHVEAGDFVISMRSFQGGLEYSELSGSISSAYVMLVPNLELVYPRFYRWLLKSEVYIRALQSTSNMVRDGQAMRYSNFSQVRLYTVPLEEQEEIAQYLDEKCKIIDNLITKKEQYLSEIENYKKSLIYEYVTGKKEVPQE